MGPSVADPFPPVSVDRVIRDGETISLGGVSLTAMITPGHTPGCTNWIMPLSEGGVSHEVIFFCSITTGGNPLVDNRAYPSIATDYKASFARLKAVAKDVDVFLAPHGDQMDLQAKLHRLERDKHVNPFVDKTGFTTLLTAMEKQFDDELARQNEARLPPDGQRIASGRDATPPEKQSKGGLDKLFTSTLVVDNVPAASYSFDKAGFFTVVLATGEVWTQQAEDNARVRWKSEPSRLIITIRRGFLGSYNLEVGGDSNRYMVRPLHRFGDE